MAKKGSDTIGSSDATLPAAFKPKHPLVLVVSAKESAQLKAKEASALLSILIALHATKTPFDFASTSECKRHSSSSPVWVVFFNVVPFFRRSSKIHAVAAFAPSSH